MITTQTIIISQDGTQYFICTVVVTLIQSSSVLGTHNLWHNTLGGFNSD